MVSRPLENESDPGDMDPGEVVAVPAQIWHASHLPAAVLPPAAHPTPTGKHFSAQLLETVKAAKASKTLHKRLIFPSCWSDTPESFKRLIARSAGLPDDVVTKSDRELSEPEKNAIRAAARRLVTRAAALLAI